MGRRETEASPSQRWVLILSHCEMNEERAGEMLGNKGRWG